MPDQLQIRVARLEDAGSIASAEHQTAETRGLLNALPGEIPLAAFERKIEELTEHPDGLYLVATNDAELAAHLLLEPMPLAQNAHICTLTIVVHPGHTDRGVGSALLNHAINWAKSNDHIEKIELRVRAGNQRAIRLYERCGFEVEGRTRRRLKYAEDEYEDDLMMGLLL